MPPPGIPNARMVNPAQRVAYRVGLGERKAAQRVAYRKALAQLHSETDRSSRISPWSIDEYGCLTRTIGK